MNIIIDNYDSFTYNLVQYVGQIDSDIKVFKNDKISIEEIIELVPDHIIISPGPGRPENSGITVEIIRELKDRFSILGICLGHQAIGYAYDSIISNAEDIFHGKTSKIYHDSDPIFNEIPSPFVATRYHSLIIDEESLHDDLKIIAKTNAGTIMGIKHKIFPLYGLQFHPESILTSVGLKIIENFLK